MGAAGSTGTGTGTAGHGTAYALRTVSVAWAFSAWTKATMLLSATRPPFARLPDDDKRYFAIYHLLAAYTALTYVRRRQETAWPLHYEIHPQAWAAVRAAQLVSPAQAPGAATATATAGVVTSDAGRGVLWRVVALTAAAMVLDELVYHALYVVLSGSERVPTGNVPKLPLADSDCIVCHGAGLDDQWFGPLETFCSNPRHGAHRRCMIAWVQSRQRLAGLCPACRAPIAFQYRSWWQATPGASIGQLLRHVEWAPVIVRSCITALCVALVSSLLQLSSNRVTRRIEAYHRQLVALHV